MTKLTVLSIGLEPSFAIKRILALANRAALDQVWVPHMGGVEII
jgi:hypothetical protein